MLYEILKTSKLGASFAPDMYTALWAQKLARDGEVKTLSGAPPLSFQANGQPLLDYLIEGNTVQSGTPTPNSPIMPEGCGEIETVGTKAGQYKIPISSNSTTTPVYLGEVETTRKIRKLVLDGTESWMYESQYSRFVLIRTDAYYSGAVRTTPCNCSHYQPIYDGRTIDNVPNESIYITSSSGRTVFNIKSTDFTSVTDFKAYLTAQYAAGTPVTVWYVLATEETAVVNEPLMKIGEYADTVSKAQTGVEIPTARGTNTLDVLTDVKPSEIYIKYKG